jgi:SAM-dependent methyltransferase
MEPAEIAEWALSLPEVDPEQASPARIYDFLLGGDHNFAVDRKAGRRAAEAMPTLQAAMRANRAFLRRVVAHLAAELGVDQFLDLGSGVPTVGNVHEIVQEINPAARVVYVDIDQVAVAHGRQLLADHPQAVSILADLRRPDTVLSHPRVAAMLDLDRPVAVLMSAVLHFIPDEHDPAGIIAEYRDAVTAGSYLALSHAAPDTTHADEQSAMLEDYQRSTKATFINRTPEQLAAWLEGWEVLPPGIVQVDDWHPEAGAPRVPILRTHGLLARKCGR